MEFSNFKLPANGYSIRGENSIRGNELGVEGDTAGSLCTGWTGDYAGLRQCVRGERILPKNQGSLKTGGYSWSGDQYYFYLNNQS